MMCNCAMLRDRRNAVRAGWIRIYGQQKRRQRCWLRVRNAEAQARPGWRQSGLGGGWVGPASLVHDWRLGRSPVLHLVVIAPVRAAMAWEGPCSRSVDAASSRVVAAPLQQQLQAHSSAGGQQVRTHARSLAGKLRGRPSGAQRLRRSALPAVPPVRQQARLDWTAR